MKYITLNIATGYTPRHAGATCQTCNVKLTPNNAEQVVIEKLGTRGRYKGRRCDIVASNYSRCRQCAAQG